MNRPQFIFVPLNLLKKKLGKQEESKRPDPTVNLDNPRPQRESDTYDK